MRVLIVTPDYPPPPGGIQTVVQNLEQGLKNLGHTPIVIQLDPDEYTPTVADIQPSQRTLAAFKMLSPHLYPYFNRVYNQTVDAIKEYNPDIIHAAHIRVWPALQAAEDYSLPSLVSAHALELGDKRLASTAFKKATAIHAVSEFTGSIIEKDHGVSPDSIIPPSIEVDSYSGPTEDSDSFENGVFTISRIVDRKNIDIIIKAWQEIDEEIRAGRMLLIAGTGPEYETLVKKTKDIDSIRMLGRISEVEKIENLKKSDLFVLPAGGADYDVEGFGIVYIEAQAAGTPVIGSSVGGVPEAVGGGGLLLDDETNHRELASKIEKLLSDEEMRSELVSQAESRIGQFQVDYIAAQYVGLYESLL